jgi:hypothetical protein
MANVFSDDPEDDETTPGARVASALQGDQPDGPPEETPTVQQPQGTVDGAAQSYMVPAEADDDQGAPAPQDAPVSADTQAYATPIAPPKLAKYTQYADHSADQAALANLKAPDAANFRPSQGRRIGAALAAGAMAFGHVPGAGEEAEKIYAAPYQRAQEEFASQQAPLQAKLAQDAAADTAVDKANAITNDQNKLAETNYQNQNRGQASTARAQDFQAQAEARANAITAFTPDDPSNPYAGGTGTTAGGKTVKGIPPPDSFINRWVKTPQGQLATQQMTLKQRGAAADQIGLKGDKRQYFLANGKLAEPTERTSVNIRENPDGSAVAPNGNGNGNGAQNPGAIIAKSIADKQAYVDGLTKLDDGTLVDNAGNPVSQKEFNDRLDKFRTDANANPVMRKSGTMIDEKGQTITNRFSRNPQVAPPAQAAAAAAPPAAPVYKAKSGATVAINTRVVVNGRPGVVTGFDAKGKPVVKY